MIEGEEFHLTFVPAHVQLNVLFGNPEMDTGVLVSGYEPLAVRRPHERVDAVRIREFFLSNKIVHIPQHHAAKVRDGNGSATRSRGEGGNCFWRGLECVRERTVAA